ncbi:FAD-dependent monooxygenase [Zavarzinella formosa]|uniref:FAD-dependent monooxygenase n=1 Tax=Zavarzinella formosa TaxID=360055 RepID=UPI00030CEFBB|nr:FAD-dependent monooxygenase [Zavarzinella formosa]
MPFSVVDALIVGAGPVGLTMAAALTHQGLKCRIIEKAPAPSDKSKALVVWCRTMELLDPLGLTEVFIKTGLKINGGSMYANGKRLVHLELTSDESPYGFPLMIPQNETERLLTEHLTQKGVTIERQTELVSFDEGPDSVNCKLRHADGSEETFVTPWLIGCDGAHSAVRHTLGLPFTGVAEPNDWILADIHVEGPLAPDEVSVFWHENGTLAFFPISNQGRFRVIADTGAASDHGRPPEPTLADAQARVDERGPGGLTLSDPVWIANFRINERKVSDYRKGRVMLSGDAAHIHSPAGGQGMNTGMQDAFNLAWKLALVQRGEGLAEPLLQSYSVERSEIGDQVLKKAGQVTKLATLRNPVAQYLRDHIAPIMGSFQFVRDKIRDEWFELSINYRHSPISADHWPRLTGGLAAGDRLCDSPLASAIDGHSSTIFTLIRDKRHTLLLLTGPNDGDSVSKLQKIADEAKTAFPGMLSAHLILRADSATAKVNHGSSELPAWLDPEGRLHEKLHAASPTLILVRPDGYIGYRCQPADGNALLAHLGGYLVRKN